MSKILYTIVIYPVYQIIEFIYQLFLRLSNEGGAIIGVSIGVTLLCLPLYAVAERWQETERDIQAKLKPGVKRIKKFFKGDEQYMILSTFYRQHHYHPLMAMRSSFGLLIQIPFFIAAYSFLSHREELQGVSFLFIKDLSKPDGLLSFGSVHINLLPILMTLINITAGSIYTKGFTLREKLQLYGMALVFLVILYDSPAGLVFYWTMNNLFSLVKDILYKVKKPLHLLYIAACAILLAADVYFISIKMKYAYAIVCFSIIIFALPLLAKAVVLLRTSILHDVEQDGKERNGIFILSAISLAVLTGSVIPSLLMVSSTLEYSYIDSYTTPLYFIGNTMLQTAGLFVFWPLCIYFLYQKKTQSVLCFLFASGLFIAMADCFLFPGNYGILLPELIFSEHKSFKPTVPEFLCNMAVIAAILALLLVLFKKRKSFVFQLTGIVSCVFVIFSCINLVKIQSTFKTVQAPKAQMTNTEPIIHLSKTENNVIVFMLDRALGHFLPEVFTECPELYDQYTGFTFYPNTVSFARWTVQGAPALYGGYEYTPWAMNHKRELPMVEKHNQAETLLPFLFESAGYHCDVIDPPYPNYDNVPVFKPFENHENISPVIATGMYSDIWYKENDYPPIPIKSKMIKRNMLWFSLFRIAPNILRSAIHYNNWWWPPKHTNEQSISNFIDRYSVLDFLPELTDTDAKKNNFIIIDNEATHDTAFCQSPDFVPVPNVTDTGKSRYRKYTGYSAMVASMKRIGEWLEYLKTNGVYDNTRIIFVADHGSAERSPLFGDSSAFPHCFEWFNPLLMIKDFNEKGRLETDMTFMTHADVPALAMDGLIENPVNPFTGNAIKLLSTEEKNAQCVISFSQANAVRSTANNGFKIKDSEWFTVHDSIFETENWKPLH